MKIIIVSGGTPPTPKLLQKEVEDCSYIIAADSGADHLHNYNLLPNLIIGDLDSIQTSTLQKLKKKNVVVEQYPKDKDFTDTQLALHKAIALHATEIVFLGCTGGKRIDHFLGSLGLLLECSQHNINAKIQDSDNIITLIDKSQTIIGIKNELFSLCAYSDLVTNLSITGAKFELANYNLPLGSPLTLSNEFLNSEVKITFDSGRLLLIRCS